MENIFRTIGYLLLLAINIVLYWFLHSHFLFIVLVIMIVAPIVSVLMAYILKKFMSVTVSPVMGEYASQNEEILFRVKINNPTLFVSLDAKLQIVVKNTFLKTEGKQVISVPIHMRKGYELEIPLRVSLPGIVRFEVKSIKIKDLIGVCYLNKKINDCAEATVLPMLVSELPYEKTSLEVGMIESEESTKRGNDFSDVNEIREYIPGDKLMSIHWKLSAKRDILMVKDRVSMSDRQLIVLPELYGKNIDILGKILVAAYSLINELIKDKTAVRLLYWSMTRYEYEDVRLDFKADLDEAFAKMFYENTYDDIELAASNMSNVYPEIRSYLHISADARGPIIKVRENG